MTQLDLFDQLPSDPDDKPAEPAPTLQPDLGMSTHPLVTVLTVAVPLWIAAAADLDQHGRAGLLERWRKDGVDVIAGNGDNILYRGPRRGDSAKAFNHLARGMAALAHQPGGVVVFGLVWCAAHSPGGVTPTAAVCAPCLAAEDTP